MHLGCAEGHGRRGQEIIELLGEGLSAGEEIKKQMELQLGDVGQQRTESIVDIRQNMRTQQSHVADVQITLKQLYDEW